MAVCTECGKTISDDAKFCDNCGAIAIGKDSKSPNQRKTVYEGELHKCPSCGAVLDSFAVNCPACGYELRSVQPAGSVRELSIRLEQIEATRVAEKVHSIYKMTNSVLIASKTDEQKASLIRTFPIPNTKEDLLEFVILANSNVNSESYVSGLQDSARVVSDAWKSKFEQAYQKAEVLFKNDPDFQYIQSLNQKMGTGIKKAKNRQWKQIVMLFVGLGIVWAVLIIGSNMAGSKDDAKELAQLKAMISETEGCLERSEYKLALMNAESIKTDSYDDEVQRQYEVQKEYLIDKVIEKASQNGVVLERTPPQDSVTSHSDVKSKGFISGFLEGVAGSISPETEGE